MEHSFLFCLAADSVRKRCEGRHDDRGQNSDARLHPLMTCAVFWRRQGQSARRATHFTAARICFPDSLFRRDQIWLRKEGKFSGTHFYSLAEFRCASDPNLESCLCARKIWRPLPGRLREVAAEAENSQTNGKTPRDALLNGDPFNPYDGSHLQPRSQAASILETPPRQFRKTFSSFARWETEPNNYFAGGRAEAHPDRWNGFTTLSLVTKAIQLRDKREESADQTWLQLFDRDDHKAQDFNAAIVLAEEKISASLL